MKVLVIDDLRLFRDDDKSRQVHVAKNSTEAIKALKDNTYDEVYFDHDLGDEDTIRPVIAFLEERFYLNNPIQIAQCFVHTSNAVGAEWIIAGLENNGYKVTRINANEVFIV